MNIIDKLRQNETGYDHQDLMNGISRIKDAWCRKRFLEIYKRAGGA